MSGYDSSEAVPPQEANGQKKRGSRKRLTQFQMQEQVKRLQELDAGGVSFEEIQREMGLTCRQLRYSVEKAGLVWVKRRPGRPRTESTEGESRKARKRRWYRRLFEIRRLHRLGLTSNQIGRELKPLLTGSRVRELLVEIRMLFGSQALMRNFVTLSQAGQLTGISEAVIRGWCAEGYLLCYESGANGQIVLGQAGLAELFWLVEPDNQHVCQNPDCQASFIHTRRQTRTCSTKCSNRLRDLERQRRGFHTNPGKTTHQVGSWQNQLEKALASQRLASDEQWVSLAKAVRCSGLSAMQVMWTGRTELLATEEGDKHNRYGQPVKLFAVSQLLIAKRVYATWRQTHPARSK